MHPGTAWCRVLPRRAGWPALRTAQDWFCASVVLLFLARYKLAVKVMEGGAWQRRLFAVVSE